MPEFPWTYDQYQRYRVLKEFLNVFYPGGHITVLDVGGLSPDRTGQSYWLPIKSVAPGPATALDVVPWDEPGYVRGDGRSLPFEDGSFDVVCALDVLEHIPPDGRERFLKELARVSKSAVFVSAPFQSSEIQTAEDLLASQIKNLYGTIQRQLQEHKQFGLPEREFVSQTLGALIPAGADFSYGSLRTWLPYQTIKNGYMLRRNSGAIHSLLDAWMAALSESSEFEPPFARHYWIYTKDVLQKELAENVETLKARLRRVENSLPSLEDLERLHREIVDFQTKKRVSALIVHRGYQEYLAEALDHILTQQVDFDLEVCAWDIRRDPECERFVRERFPAVKYFAVPIEAKLPNALLQVASRLLGDYILLFCEDVFLPAETVTRFVRELENDPRTNLLAPRVLDDAGKSHVWLGVKNSATKAAAGIHGKFSAGTEPQMADWIYSECLFFRREALWERASEPRPVTKQNLFLWERSEDGKALRYASGITVPQKPMETSTLNILHCMHQYHPARGGSEWLMQNVSERLAGRGHEVRVIATNAYSTEDYFLPHRGKTLMPLDEKDIDNVLVKRVPFTRKGRSLLNLTRGIANRVTIPFGDRLKMLSWGPRSRAYRKEVLRAPEPDLIVACPLPSHHFWYAWKGAKKRNLPFIAVPCYHTEDPWTFHTELHFKILREADAVITLTEWEKDYLVREGRLDPAKVFTLGIGIDLDGEPPPVDIRGKYGIREKEIVLFLGQHGRHKGILDLLYSMRDVWKERKDAALVIAGNPTVHTAELEENILTLTPEERERVYLIKSFPEGEKRAFMRAADLFVSVSAFESFGIVYLEAWREKKAVIGCRRGASAQLIREFVDGLQVYAQNPIELAGAILELLEHPEVRERMGRNGYEKVVRDYSWARIMDKWEDIYYDAVHKRRNSR